MAQIGRHPRIKFLVVGREISGRVGVRPRPGWRGAAVLLDADRAPGPVAPLARPQRDARPSAPAVTHGDPPRHAGQVVVWLRSTWYEVSAVPAFRHRGHWQSGNADPESAVVAGTITVSGTVTPFTQSCLSVPKQLACPAVVSPASTPTRQPLRTERPYPSEARGSRSHALDPIGSAECHFLTGAPRRRCGRGAPSGSGCPRHSVQLGSCTRTPWATAPHDQYAKGGIVSASCWRAELRRFR